MSDIDTQFQNSTVVCHQDFSGAENENFGLKWPLERGSALSTFFNTQKILEICSPKTEHVLLEKNYSVVLSFNAHCQNMEYNSKPQSQKIPSESIH